MVAGSLVIAGMAAVPFFRMPAAESFAASAEILGRLRSSSPSVPLRPVPSFRELRARAAASPAPPQNPLLSPQLKQYRDELLRAGAIRENEFRQLKTAKEVEAFVGKFLDLKVKKKGLSAAEAGRIKRSMREGYDDLAKGIFFKKRQKR